MLTLDPMPKIITFDCYGTLVQWHGTMRKAARAILFQPSREGHTEDEATTLADRLRELAMTRQQRAPFRGYKAVLRSSLDQALADSGYRANPDDQEMLLSMLRRIEPHPEVPAAGALPARDHQQHR